DFDDILVRMDDWDEMEEFENFWMDDIVMLFHDDDDDVVFVEEPRGEGCEFKEDRGDDDVVFVEERRGSGSMWYEGDGDEDGLLFMVECVLMNV
ncbi:unnamed protein product, partial [Didymodactylos carnosus]